MKRLIGCLCVVFLILSSCNKTEKTASAAKKVVNVALSENLLRLDPHNQMSVPGMVTQDMVYDTLVRSDRKGNYSPWLATEWNVSADSLTWTFKLKEGVKFHNGEAFNADDVVATLQRMLNNRTLTQASTNWALLEKVEKKGEYEVAVTMKEPFGAMLLSLGDTFIIPNEAYTEYGDKLFTEQIMYGTGPWVFDEWVDGQYAHFTKNNDYWAGNNSKYDEVYFRFILESSTAIAAQLSGDIDAYIPSNGIVSDLLSLYNGHDNIGLVRFDAGVMVYMGFQCGEHSVFNDKNVRKAFSMAINRQEIIDNILEGGALSSGMLPPGSLGYDPGLPVYEYDPAGAKALLASSSYKGQPIKITSTTGVKKGEEQMLAISEMVNAAGFNSSIEIVESATLTDMRTQGKYDVFAVALVHQAGDPFMAFNFRILNDAHHSDYKNPEMLRLIRDSNYELDQAKRAEDFRKANEILRNEYAPQIVLYNMQVVFAVNKDVTGVDYYPDGWFFLRHLGQ